MMVPEVDILNQLHQIFHVLLIIFGFNVFIALTLLLHDHNSRRGPDK